jgi:ribosome-associated translation inhibitor RaiA
MTVSSGSVQPVVVQVVLRGEVPEAVADYARLRVQHVCGLANHPVLSARLVLTLAADPAVERPARAEASLDLSGTQLRAAAVAAELREAADLLAAKLRQNLLQHQERQRERSRWIGESTAHQWRKGDLPSPHLAHHPRAPEDRELVRRKTFALQPMSADEAAYEMDLLGHDFFLFTDGSTRHEAVVYRERDGRFAIRGDAVPAEESAVRIEVVRDAPTLTEGEARERLDLSGEPFVFYLDPRTGRGRVLYLRYDGHYGLITPIES